MNFCYEMIFGHVLGRDDNVWDLGVQLSVRDACPYRHRGARRWQPLRHSEAALNVERAGKHPTGGKGRGKRWPILVCCGLISYQKIIKNPTRSVVEKG